MVGNVPSAVYTNYEFVLKKGDTLFLYTDGAPEATCADEKMFTEERMTALLSEHKDASPQELLETMKKGIDDFVGDAPQLDDLTMLCFKRK